MSIIGGFHKLGGPLLRCPFLSSSSIWILYKAADFWQLPGMFTAEARMWNMTVLQPQSIDKKENQQKLSQAHIPTFWSLPYEYIHIDLCMYVNVFFGNSRDVDVVFGASVEQQKPREARFELARWQPFAQTPPLCAKPGGFQNQGPVRTIYYMI